MCIYIYKYIYINIYIYIYNLNPRYKLPIFRKAAALYAVCDTKKNWDPGVKEVQIKMCLSYEMHVGNLKGGSK